MASRRLLTALLAGTAVGAFSAGAGIATASTPAPGYRFSHEVVVDQQRSGFEPDIEVGRGDALYSSVPFGSSTTLSWLWSSLDHGNSFQFVPGQILDTGRLETCPQGGGDTELALDPKGDLFFSDLQNLSNLTNSVSTNGGATFLSNCVGAPNTPVDRMWYATQGSLGDPNFRIYEDYDAVVSGTDLNNVQNDPTNQLVLTVSTNGLTFFPVVNPSFTGDCLGGGSLNCVTDNEGISGNIKLDPTGHVLIAHTTGDGNQIVVSRGTITGTAPAALTASYVHTILDKTLCPDFAADSAHLGKSEICGAANFATIAEDSAGHFYEAFASQQRTDKLVSGSPSMVITGPYEVYVAASKDGVTWGQPVQVSSSGSNAFPWITAGSDGRVAIAWYHTNETHEGSDYTFDGLNHAEFSVQAGISLNAMAATPSYTTVMVSEHPIKYGQICTQGLGCTVSNGDRSLGDFLQVNHDARGALVFSYVDDTSNYFAVGPTGAVASSGPPVVVRQIAGPSLTTGMITGPGAGPGAPEGSVIAQPEPASYSGNGTRTTASENLDLTYASLSRDAKGLVVTMKVKSLASLLTSPAVGGTTGEWIMRFTTYDPAHNGNGNIYYAAMESIAGATPTFVAGQPQATQAPTLQAVFDSSTAIPGSYDPKTGTILMEIPFSDLGGHGPGTRLYSATAFTALTVGTLAGNQAGQFNLTKSAPPFDYTIPGDLTFTGSVEPAGSIGARGPIKAAQPAAAPGGSLPSTGGLGAPLAALIVLTTSLVVRRLRSGTRS
ncbi:MAG TPA: hypothetical protein VNG13_06915 [Mycobacteriales bacterium]|nr:hypothetical protein [Mycobacteriales bacterium]